MVRIASWNVNSINARLANVERWLKETDPHIVLLQELKCIEEAFPKDDIESLGYNVEVVGQKTYNGVAILSKFPIDVELRALPGDSNDTQARYLEAFTGSVRVASIYLPNGNPYPSQKFDYKLNWMERLYTHTANLLRTEDAFLLGGDFNVIRQAGDVYNPESFKNDALYQLESQAALRKITNLGLTDALRAITTETGLYSWWGYMAGGWQKDHGVLIDHLLLSPQAADRLEDCQIDRRPRGWEKPSDHTPIWCDLKY